jgi:cytochrome c oxidase subunit 4
MSDPVKSTRLYWMVFGALILLTILTVGQSRIEGLGHTTNRIIGIAVAITKGSLVALVFMHLKYEKKYFYPVVIFPLILVLIIIFANLPDVAFGGLEGHTTPAVELKPGGGH